MAEYIKREAVIELFKDPDRCGYLDIFDIASVPAADVAPVVHAKWVKRYAKDMDSCELSKCSMCGKHTSTMWGRTKYCPHCGARMDGE